MADLGITKIPEEMSKDLARFVKRPSQQIESVISKALEIEPTSGISAFVQRIARELKFDVTDVGNILSILRNLKRVEEYSELRGEQLLKSLGSSLKLRGWDEDQLQAYNELLPTIERALEQLSPDSGLMVSAKTTRLAYERQNVLHKSRILTDLRPVFNESASEIKDMILTHSLVLYYSDGAKEPQELHLTLDWRDIAQLREACDRADLKSKRILELMKNNRWPTINYPEIPDQ